MTALVVVVLCVLAFNLGPNPKLFGMPLGIVGFAVCRAIWNN